MQAMNGGGAPSIDPHQVQGLYRMVMTTRNEVAQLEQDVYMAHHQINQLGDNSNQLVVLQGQMRGMVPFKDMGMLT